MMDYDKHRKENQVKFTLKRLRAGLRRGPRRRFRDPEEELALLKMARTRRQAWLASGKLEVLGPRQYRLNLD